MPNKNNHTTRLTAITLGYLGLIPPLISLLGGLVDYLSPNQSFEFSLLYCSMILSFLGGAHWHAGLISSGNQSIQKLVVGIIASLLGICSMMVGGVLGAVATSVGLLALGAIEKYRPLISGDNTEWYLMLRINLTLGLVTLLAANQFYLFRATGSI